MNTIVQLSQYEYDKLKEQATATQEIIDKIVAQEVKKLCNLQLEVKMDIGRDWQDIFHIKPYADFDGKYVYGDKNIMSFTTARKLSDKIRKWMQKQIEVRYGFDIKQVNRYRRANENRWKWLAFWTILSASGWAAALITWILK